MPDLTVFTGGPVLPDFDGGAAESALAIREGRIVALGDPALSLLEQADEVVDLRGGVVMPSFGDGHAHPIFGALEFQGPRIGELESVAAVVEEVARWAGEHPEREWIVAGSYDPTLAPRGEFDARWLDAAVPDRPVVLRAFDYHTVWCNSEALRRAGITESTPDPTIGSIVRRPDGTPAGTLREWHACDLVLDRAGEPDTDSLATALDDAARVYAAAGVTWIQDAWVDPEQAAAYLRAARENRLKLRTDLAPRAVPERWQQQRAEFAELRRAVEHSGNAWLTANTVKFFVDGVVENRTAALLEPYADTSCGHGQPVWSADELARAATAFDADGFQLHFHAIGDAAVRVALDAVAVTERVNPSRDRRPVIAHAQLVDAADLARFDALGVIANLQPFWMQLDPLMTELTVPRLGTERAERQYPAARLHESGVKLAFGSDWPISSPRPLDGLQVAVTRRTLDGLPPEGWSGHQCLDVTTALRAYTTGVAEQAFAEHHRGRLAVGASADLVWLSADPVTVVPSRITEIEVLGTWACGHRLH
ncbi:hypothetical protein FHX42_001938 [Saccharopolyspora lacisalsi]|uniref:Amidohydrolase 3 domain-containing protein n=1 Tax=Halosaccharopolyspora lacisalsi TaxID=1000566 RepID=A0A839DZE4_9PSEU|nr:amidohydrolase [Halosaccharopolyspora lacisalsi]MBA8824591.1 hypothetical protein [Halosaccharopolyspora lacisalsi]